MNNFLIALILSIISIYCTVILRKLNKRIYMFIPFFIISVILIYIWIADINILYGYNIEKILELVYSSIALSIAIEEFKKASFSKFWDINYNGKKGKK